MAFEAPIVLIIDERQFAAATPGPASIQEQTRGGASLAFGRFAQRPARPRALWGQARTPSFDK
jgi:hypothetical protein